MTAIPSARADDEIGLMSRLRLGDEAALSEVYRRFAALVHGVAVRVTGDRAAAEEIAQQVFLHAWTHAATFDAGRGSLRGWLSMLSHRRAVDWVRHETLVRREVPTPLGHAASAEEEAIDASVARRVRAVVDTLPEQHRAVVRMLYFDDLSVREVASRLGIPEGTVKTRLRTARHSLADRLGTEGLVTVP